MKDTIVLCSPLTDDFRDVVKSGKTPFFPPLGLFLVAQTLKNAGYRVKFYDGNFSMSYKNDILRFISENGERVVFIGFYLALLQIKDCIDIIKAVRRITSEIPIVIGGPFPSVFPNLIMKSGLVDVCCIGDGAETAEKLARHIQDRKGLRDIPNIAFIDNGTVIFTQKGNRDRLDSSNRIFYEDFINIEDYVNYFDVYLIRKYTSSIKRAIPVLTGLGCSYKCAFCENALLNHKHISLSAEEIVEQIVYYNRKFDIDTFVFFDEDFFIDKPRLLRLLELLLKNDLKIKWGTQCRANYFTQTYINEKLLREMGSSGCIRLTIGIESGSPKVLKKINKGITPEQAIQVAEYGKTSSIYFSYSFIINLPFETREDLGMTLSLIDRLLAIKQNSFVSALHHYFAYPGTPLSIEAEKKYGYGIEDRFTFEQLADISLEQYNVMSHSQKKDMYRECMMHYWHILRAPSSSYPGLKKLYYSVFKVIGIIRKRLNFYHLPLEVYLIVWARAVKERLSRHFRYSD